MTMKRIIPVVLFCGVFALLAATGCNTGDAGKDDIKVKDSSVKMKQGETKEVAVTQGTPVAKDTKAPADSKLEVSIDGKNIKIKAPDDAKTGKHSVTVKGDKGAAANIDVTVEAK